MIAGFEHLFGLLLGFYLPDRDANRSAVHHRGRVGRSVSSVKHLSFGNPLA